MAQWPTTIFLGTTGGFSLAVLDRLLAAGASPRAVITPDTALTGLVWLHPPPPRSPIQLAQPSVRRSVIERAWERGIPVAAAGRLRRREVADAIMGLGADLACVACFPWRVPGDLIARLPQGALNVHPSLLPARRGPSPVFWALRAGDLAMGATVHWMDAGLDTGPIAAQAPLELPEGVAQSDAERDLALLGGGLLADVLRDLGQGRRAARGQGPDASYDPWPRAEHFTLEASWPARRAFIFMRGAAEWGRPFMLALPGATLALDAATGYDPAAALGQPFRQAGEQFEIAMAPGVLRARGRLLREAPGANVG